HFAGAYPQMEGPRTGHERAPGNSHRPGAAQPRVRATAAVLVAACSGCSLAFVSGPGERPPGEPVRCTRDSVAPIVDNYVALATSLIGVGLGLSLLFPSQRSDVPLKLGVAGGLLAASAVYGISAQIGFGRIGRCNRAARSREEWLE